jgi:hypothetical protein
MRSSFLVRGSYLSLLVFIRCKGFESEWLMILLGLKSAGVGLLSGKEGLDPPLLLFLDNFKLLPALWPIDKNAVTTIFLISEIIKLLLLREFDLKREDRNHLDWGPVDQ